MIYEGTNGIQSIDLLHRKVTADNMLAYKTLQNAIRKTVNIAKNEHGSYISKEADLVEEALDRHINTTTSLFKSFKAAQATTNDPAILLANCHEYLNFTGHTVVAWMWLKQGIAAAKGLQREDCSEHDKDFYRGKIMALKYFCHHELIKTVAQAQLLEKNPQTNNDMKDAWF